jgi:hypothetical protein
VSTLGEIRDSLEAECRCFGPDAPCEPCRVILHRAHAMLAVVEAAAEAVKKPVLYSALFDEHVCGACGTVDAEDKSIVVADASHASDCPHARLLAALAALDGEEKKP